MIELKKLSRLRDTVREWHADDKSVALVPTMGALHAGHLHLATEARKHADRVVVSIFVNPKQFGPNEDFARYPRPIEKDIEALNRIGADALWLPSVEEMYPDGFATSIHVAGPSEGLDGAARPGHFDGVATVVAKLLLQVSPDVALFGEKDYQQLCVIRQLVRDLNLDVAIVGVPTVRDINGLALSSRNQYLSEEERQVAPKLYATLRAAASQLVIPAQAGILESTPSMDQDSRLRGNDVERVLEKAKTELIAAGFREIDYLELRAADTLAPLDTYQSPARLLIAAWLGTTRLIDNIAVE